ncbi:MAG: hypothetical protein ABI896_11055 [Actinomycetota bacterium]
MADVVEKKAGARPVPLPVARREGKYSRRFAVVQLLVMVLFAGLLALFALLISRSGSHESWSSFKPSGGETFGRAQNVANYVAPRYISNGAPLAVVQAQPLVYKEAVVDGIAFLRAPAQGVGSPYTQFETASKTMLYVFCGAATGCGLPNPGIDVTPLLREESLELALYTFKYFPGINSVVTLLPPDRNRHPALLLRRRKLTAELEKPLAATLPKRDRITVASITDVEAVTVQQLTESSIFLSSFQQTPNGHTLLLLGRR